MDPIIHPIVTGEVIMDIPAGITGDQVIMVVIIMADIMAHIIEATGMDSTMDTMAVIITHTIMEITIQTAIMRATMEKGLPGHLIHRIQPV